MDSTAPAKKDPLVGMTQAQQVAWVKELSEMSEKDLETYMEDKLGYPEERKQEIREVVAEMKARDETHITMFGWGAIAVGISAFLIQLSPLVGVRHQHEVELWRKFAWFLFFALALLRVWIEVASDVCALAFAESSSIFIDYIIRPCTASKNAGRWRKSKTAESLTLMKEGASPGGSWDVDDRLLDLFVQEAEGVCSVVWILAAAWLAAVMAGVKSAGSFQTASAFVIALVVWRFTAILSQSLTIASDAILKQKHIEIDCGTVKGFRRFQRIFIWACAGLFIISNFGYNISAALTGLGLTGVVVAFSTQAVLADLLSWADITINRPFLVEDWVVVGDVFGMVEKIRFFTTSLRTPEGNLAVIRNNAFGKSTVVNYMNVSRRRFELDIEVSALCSTDLLEEVPKLVKSAVEQQADCNYEHCWMEGLVPFGYKFSYQFYAKLPDMQEARTASTEIWLRILRSFQEKGITLASTDRLQRGLGGPQQ